MGRALLLALGVLASLGAARAPVSAQIYSCRGYPPPEVVAQIKRQVEALRMVERETVDRIAGLDTRPFDHLVGQARAATAIIADKNELEQEAELSRCRNHIPPVRRTCAAAAGALVRIVEENSSGTTTKVSKEAYMAAMPQCERWVGLAPLKTALRIAD